MQLKAMGRLDRCGAWWGGGAHVHTSVVHGAAAPAASATHAPAAVRGRGRGGGFQKR